MRVAIPLYGNRVSPRFAFSVQTLMVEINDGHVTQKEILHTDRLDGSRRLEQLISLGVNIFICGAVEQAFLTEAGSLDIQIVPDVAGEVEEVLELLVQGGLLPGHGTYADPAETVSQQSIDCISCLDRVCLTGGQCPGLIRDLHTPEGTAEHIKILEVAMDISLETERKLCRVAEFVHFCHGMGYKHVGVAFCVELFRETQILTHLLRRFLRVTPVCCKIGGHQLTGAEYFTRGANISCNPLGQAAELNRVCTDINAVVGLCMGCDVVLARHSVAPVTTLFVKDRLLANNPVGALYSHYYQTELVEQTRLESTAVPPMPKQGVEP